MTNKPYHHTVLSIYPTSWGLSFVVFRDPLELDDWGSRRVGAKDKDERCLLMVAKLLDRHSPECIVLHDANAPGSLRRKRIRKLTRLMATLVRNRGIDVHLISCAEVRLCFDAVGARTKQRRAEVTAEAIVALDHRLPTKRKPWESEKESMSIFDAAALGITFYQSRGHDVLPREDIEF